MKKLIVIMIFIHFQGFSQNFLNFGTSFNNEYVTNSEWGDFDNDGDLDVLTNYEDIKVYRNDEGVFSDIGLIFNASNDCYASWGDFDNDGDLDLAIVYDYIYFYEYDEGNYTLFHRADEPASSNRTLKWTDIDNDGDLDLIFSGFNYGAANKTLIYINEDEQFNFILTSLTGTRFFSVDAGDYDNDGDIDLLMVNNTVQLFYNAYLNFYPASSFFEPAPDPYVFSDAVFSDYDLDGDLDILAMGKADQSPYDEYLEIYENQNNAFFTYDIGFEYDMMGKLVNVVDIENDGDMDFFSFCASPAWSEINEEGSYNMDAMSLDGYLLNGLLSGSADMVDFNGDGYLDVLYTGTKQSGSYVAGLYLNAFGTSNYQINTPPSCPANLQASVSGYDITFSWDSSTDDQTPAVSLMYNLRVGKTAGGSEVLSAMANPDGRLLSVHPGNALTSASKTIRNLVAGTYYWSVQAIDQGMMGSTFAAEQTVMIVNPLPVPVLLSPPDNATNQDYTISLSWAPVNLATYYQVQIAYDQDFEQLIFDETTIYTNFTADSLRLETYFYWRVKAFSSNSSSSWSQIWRFKTRPCFLDIDAAMLPYIKGLDVHWGDYDNDGDFDLLTTGTTGTYFWEPKIYRNDYAVFTDTYADLKNYESNFCRWTDIDNDNDLDIILKAINVFICYNDSGTFLRTDTVFVSIYGNLDFCDFDRDGDIDMLGTSNQAEPDYDFFILENTTDGFNVLKWVGQGCFGAGAFLDYDNDYDWDFIVDGGQSLTYDLATRLFKNNNGIFQLGNSNITGFGRGYMKSFDFDGDADLDILLSGYIHESTTDVATRLYANNPYQFTDTEFEFSGTPFDFEQSIVFSDLIWGDFDNDGDNDIMIGEEGGIYRNDNNVYNQSGVTFEDIGKHFDWADYDNDGDLDMAIIGNGQQSKILKNDSYIFNNVPGPPSGLSAHATPGELHLSWDQGLDQETKSQTLSYNIFVWSATDGKFIMAPSADQSTGRRKIAQMGNVHQMLSYNLQNVPPGKYAWAVQAIDNGFLGSPFALADTVILLGVPQRITPENDSLISHNHVSFLWHQTKYASGYRFQLSTDSSFNSTIIDSICSDTAIGYIVTPNLNIPRYYWRLHAFNDDGYGAWTDTWHINVPIRDFLAGFSEADSGYARIAFFNTSTGDFNYSKWDFGDGDTAISFNAEHIYDQNGNYEVSLYITDSSISTLCFDHFIKSIIVTSDTIISSCKAAYTVYPDPASSIVYVIDHATGDSLSYLWNFGDGDTSLMTYPLHFYVTDGQYNLCQIVEDRTGCTDAFCDTIGPYRNSYGKDGFEIRVVPIDFFNIPDNDASTRAVKIYPNPASSCLSIVTHLFEITKAEIMDLTGKTIKEFNSGLDLLDISELTCGLYFIRLTGHDGIKMEMFIKR